STTLEYNKQYIYKSPQNQYQWFCNAFAYGLMIITEDPIYPKKLACEESNKVWKEIKNKSKNVIENIIESLTINTIPTILDLVPAQNFTAASSVQNRIIGEIVVPDAPPPNAAAQHKVTEAIVKINSEIEKCQKTYNTTTDQEVKFKLLEHIQCLKQTLYTENKELQENQQVVKYDSPEHPSLLFKHPDLLEQIHNKKNYNEHISYTTVCNYLLPRHQNSIAARKHHHPTNIQ
ncbi:7558_t:CDS:2, partial [Cetraspora pellucida]